MKSLCRLMHYILCVVCFVCVALSLYIFKYTYNNIIYIQSFVMHRIYNKFIIIFFMHYNKINKFKSIKTYCEHYPYGLGLSIITPNYNKYIWQNRKCSNFQNKQNYLIIVKMLTEFIDLYRHVYTNKQKLFFSNLTQIAFKSNTIFAYHCDFIKRLKTNNFNKVSLQKLYIN